MQKFIFILSLLLVTSSTLFAQQNIFAPTGPISSPIVNKDGSVTLHLQAPTATHVEVKGDWLPAGTTVPMTKNTDGVWSYTSGPLASDLYIYQFIVNGTALLDPLNVYQIRDVSSLFSIFVIEGGQGDLYQVQEVPHGTVAKRWYHSPTLDMTRRLTIYTPPGYETSNESYPVLYLLHGMGGDEEAWPTLGRTAQILDNLIATGKCKPMLVVMPNGNVAQEAAPGESSLNQTPVNFNLPHTMDGTYENSFEDIIAFIEGNYRAKANKENRAIAGLSMGGFHSLWISANYPNTFGYVGHFSGAVNPRENNDLSQGVPRIYENMDGKLAQQRDNGLILYWIAIGTDDFLYQEVKDYRAKLDSLQFPYQYVETAKGHVWSNWRLYLSQFTPLLFK